MALFIVPLGIVGVPLLVSKAPTTLNGLVSASTGKSREAEYREIRARATKSMFIVGIGMSKLSQWAKESLREQALKVPIEFLMIDPDYLDQHPDFGRALEDYIGARDYCRLVRTAFEELKKLCREHNGLPGNKPRMALRVYSGMNTVSAVIIDEEHPSAAAVFDIFMYRSGDRRLVFNAVRSDAPDDAFHAVRQRLRDLWDARTTRKIIS